MDHTGSSPNRLSTANWTLNSILSLGNRFRPVHRSPSWNANLLSPEWLANRYTEPLPVRNVYSREDQRMPIAELLSKYSAGKEYAHPEDSERWYGKDLPFRQSGMISLKSFRAKCFLWEKGTRLRTWITRIALRCRGYVYTGPQRLISIHRSKYYGLYISNPVARKLFDRRKAWRHLGLRGDIVLLVFNFFRRFGRCI
ncbi:hypothetical protein BS47DRAFT_445868 [Hydnum rufescens UP504]|uniref:Uncharacterized protein n=1 Tax=Hydnum rufescens UP504 TaxID=1448309 RepID=A0A9P6B5K0_9AGAM|nr:hypothetical protein BS47DRAFT_445868 [Hydnum rufescens UP504]